MKKLICLMVAMAMACCCGVAETAKHERVYITANADGSVKTLIDSIYLENADGLKEITDSTRLTSIENVGGHEGFALEGESLVWKAEGSSIRYQGTSDKAPAALPVCEVSGDTLSVRFDVNSGYPVAALCVLPVKAGAEGLTLENAYLVSEGGLSFVVALCVPGSGSEYLPEGFSVKGVKSLSYMYTFATAEPAKLLSEKLDSLDSAKLLLESLAGGNVPEEIPEEFKTAVGALSTLLDGTAQLSAGAEQLSQGAAQVNDGTAQLAGGLDTLTQNNAALSEGAAQIFGAILDTANASLAESGLELPLLTAENYAEVLDSAIATLNAAPETARAQITAKVEENDELIRSKVLEAAGVTMTPAEFAVAASSRLVPAAKVEAYENAVAEQKSILIEQNMASEEVQAKLTAAEAGVQSLTALKAKLDSVNSFVTGLDSYLGGTMQLKEGADTLSSGTSALSEGASALSEGAMALDTTLRTRLAEAAQKALDFMSENLPEIPEGAEASYDALPEGMSGETVYIIRTDF